MPFESCARDAPGCAQTHIGPSQSGSIPVVDPGGRLAPKAVFNSPAARRRRASASGRPLYKRSNAVARRVLPDKLRSKWGAALTQPGATAQRGSAMLPGFACLNQCACRGIRRFCWHSSGNRSLGNPIAQRLFAHGRSGALMPARRDSTCDILRLKWNPAQMLRAPRW